MRSKRLLLHTHPAPSGPGGHPVGLGAAHQARGPWQSCLQEGAGGEQPVLASEELIWESITFLVEDSATWALVMGLALVWLVLIGIHQLWEAFHCRMLSCCPIPTHVHHGCDGAVLQTPHTFISGPFGVGAARGPLLQLVGRGEHTLCCAAPGTVSHFVSSPPAAWGAEQAPKGPPTPCTLTGWGNI